MGRADRRERMRRLLRRREREGLTYAELARRTGESVHTLSWWAWKLRQEKRAPAERGTSFVEVHLAPEMPAGDGAVEVVLGGGRRIEVRPGFDESTLRRVLAILEQPC